MLSRNKVKILSSMVKPNVEGSHYEKNNKKYAVEWASEDGFYWIYFKQPGSTLGDTGPK